MNYLPIDLKKMNTRRARPKLPPNIQTRNALPAAAKTGARSSVVIRRNGLFQPYIA